MINWVCVYMAEKGWNQVCLDEKPQHIDCMFETLYPLGANHPQIKKYLFSMFLIRLLEPYREVFLHHMHTCTHACKHNRNAQIN